MIILLAYDNPKPAFPGSNTTAGGWAYQRRQYGGPDGRRAAGGYSGPSGRGETYTANADVLVPNLSGLNLADATSALQKNSLTLRTVGDGGTVTGQIPAAGASIPGGSQVVLYMGEAVPTDQVQVPSVIGLTAEQARQKLADAGLYMRATGATEYGSHVVAYETVHRRRCLGQPGYHH
ncbi:MAG: PASTA domain-containing protein [Lawsonibacter sp.]